MLLSLGSQEIDISENTLLRNDGKVAKKIQINMTWQWYPIKISMDCNIRETQTNYFICFSFSIKTQINEISRQNVVISFALINK